VDYWLGLPPEHFPGGGFILRRRISAPLFGVGKPKMNRIRIPANGARVAGLLISSAVLRWKGASRLFRFASVEIKILSQTGLVSKRCRPGF